MNVKVNSAQFKEWARENRTLAAVCRAQAAAELTRERVNAYIKPVFESFGFVYCGDLAEKLDTRAGEKFVGKPLESEKDLYLCDDPRLQEYFDACDAAHRADGYDLPKGHCPALRMATTPWPSRRTTIAILKKARLAHCNYKGKQETTHGGTFPLPHQTTWREIFKLRGGMLAVKGSSDLYHEDEEKNDRIEYRNCLKEFRLITAIEVEFV